MPESFFHNESRVDKFDKRRKNTKLINFLIGLGAFFAIFLILLIVFGDDDKETAQNENNADDIEESQQEPDLEEDNSSIAAPNEEQSDTITDDEIEENTDSNDTATNDLGNGEPTEETILESDDPNVLKVIVKDWQPIGTEQEEPHVATYDQSSLDWQEMWAAARYATGISEDDEIQWWATNGGNEHKAILTISNKAQTDTYRVYVEWVANEGWKPTMVEVLKVNDIKEKYFSNSSESEEETDNESEE